MKDITIIIPVHALANDTDRELYRKALASVKTNQENYPHKLTVMTVGPGSVKSETNNIMDEVLGDAVTHTFQTNKGKTSFCAQVNCGAKHVKTDYFSILEFDDEYTTKWFELASHYFLTHEDVSAFLPLVVQGSEEGRQYCNEVVWAMAFSEVIGFIDEEALKNWPSFNLDGAIFSTKDFNHIDGFDTEMELAFNYELLVRMVSKYNMKVFVVPRIGYVHLLGREGSLLNIYNDTMSEEEAREWFNKARQSFVVKKEEE